MVLLFALLGFGAVLLFVQPHVIAAVRDGALREEWLLAAPGTLFAVVLLLLFDAVVLATRRGFFTGRSLLHVSFGLALLGIAATGAWREYRVRKAPPQTSSAMLEELMKTRDARVRSLIMEVCGHRATGEDALLAMLSQGLEDPDPMVWRAALAAVERRAGRRLGGGRERARAWVLGRIEAGDGDAP